MKYLLYFALQLYYRVEYFLFRCLPAAKENSVLILRLDSLGDAVIWMDAAKEYKKHFAGKCLTLLCNAVWKELAEALPYFDEVISLERRKFERNIFYRLKILFGLSRRNFVEIVNPVWSRDFFVQDVLMHNLRSPKKVGYSGSYYNTTRTLLGFGRSFAGRTDRLRQRADRWYSHLIEGQTTAMMELSRNAEFVRKYLDPNFHSRLPEVPFPLPIFPGLPQDYLVLFLGASTTRRVWRTTCYCDLINALPDNHIVICGGKGDVAIWRQVEQQLSTTKTIFNLVGKTSLKELFTVIAHARYLITNETAASHITVAVRTPSLCLLGGNHFGRFHPYQVEQLREEDRPYLPKVVYHAMSCFGCNGTCRYTNDKNTIWPCIAGITVEQVLDSLGR
jgi:ADP-heptose:LPS heptosyltransferase